MKPYELKLVFDSENDAKYFIAWWLDGGGEQHSDFNTDCEQSEYRDKHTAKWLKLTKCDDPDS